ncbi:MAG: hypothetical protein IPN68_03450 [Bacteroidetes bacterium]|nr:hypothetical protein [Bacteroidota bacterium]
MEGRKKHSIEPLLEKAEDYGQISFELLKLKTLDKISSLASSIVVDVTVVLIVSMFIIVGTIGASLWLGEILGKSWYGFFTVSGIYGITGIIFYFILKKWLKKVIGNLIIRNVLK